MSVPSGGKPVRSMKSFAATRYVEQMQVHSVGPYTLYSAIRSPTVSCSLASIGFGYPSPPNARSHVIGMLVGEQDAIERDAAQTQRIEAREDLARRKPTVDEHAMAAVADVGAVASRSGAKDRHNQILVEQEGHEE